MPHLSPSPPYDQQVTSAPHFLAMMKLRDIESDDDRDRAAANGIAPGRRSEFLRMTGGRLSERGVCIIRLFGGRCGQTYGAYRCPEHSLPGADHAAMLIRGGKPVAYLSQPYRLDAEIVAEIAAFCERMYLDVEFRIDLSWHFPGHTYLIIVSRNGTRVFPARDEL